MGEGAAFFKKKKFWANYPTWGNWPPPPQFITGKESNNNNYTLNIGTKAVLNDIYFITLAIKRKKLYAFKVGVTETCIVGVGMLSEDIKMSMSVMIWIDLV